MHPGRLKICRARGWVEAGNRAEMQRFPEERKFLTLTGALNQRAWIRAWGLIFSIFSSLVSMHRHSLRGMRGCRSGPLAH